MHMLKSPVRKKLSLQPMAGADNSPTEGDGRRHRSPNWDAHMDRFLVDLMIKEMHRKNYHSGNFNSHSWTSLSTTFNTAMGLSFTKDQVKDHWRNLRRRFSLYEDLLKLSGWGWDDEQKIPYPGYDGAWEEVIKVNSKFSQIKRRPFPLYDEMRLLCKNSMATGDNAEGFNHRGARTMTGSTSTPTIEDHINEFRNAIPTAPRVDDEFLQPKFSLGDTQDMMNISSGQQGCASTGRYPTTPFMNSHQSLGDIGSASPKRKQPDSGKTKNSKRIAQASLDHFAELTRQRNDLMATMLSNGSTSGKQQNQCSPKDIPIPNITQSLKELKEIANLPRQIYLKAMKLFTDPNMRLLFSAMADEDKVEWLMMMTSDAPSVG